MTEQEIKNGIKAVCEISTEIATLYADNNALVTKLNSVPQDELQKASILLKTKNEHDRIS